MAPAKPAAVTLEAKKVILIDEDVTLDVTAAPAVNAISTPNARSSVNSNIIVPPTPPTPKSKRKQPSEQTQNKRTRLSTTVKAGNRVILEKEDGEEAIDNVDWSYKIWVVQCIEDSGDVILYGEAESNTDTINYEVVIRELPVEWFRHYL